MNGNPNHSPQTSDHQENSNNNAIDQMRTNLINNNFGSQQTLTQAETQSGRPGNERMEEIFKKALNDTIKNYSNATILEKQVNITVEALFKILNESQSTSSMGCQCCSTRNKTEFETSVIEIVRKNFQQQQQNGMQLLPREKRRKLSMAVTHAFTIPERETVQSGAGPSQANQILIRAAENRRGSAGAAPINETAAISSTMMAPPQLPATSINETVFHTSDSAPKLHIQQPPHQQHQQQLPSTPQATTVTAAVGSPLRLQLQQSFQMNSPPATPRSSRMPFTSPTTLLPPLPIPPILRSPLLPPPPQPRLSLQLTPTSTQPQRCHIPFCNGGFPRPPHGISVDQYQNYMACMLQAQQQNRFPPPSLPPTSSNNNQFTSNLQTGGNPYLQQFPRTPLDPQQRERLNQMFYANVLRPPLQQQPPQQVLPPQQQQQQQNQPPPQLQPQQPQTQPKQIPARRRRKRKRSPPEKFVSIIPRPSMEFQSPSLQQQPQQQPQEQHSQQEQSDNNNSMLPPLSVPNLATNRSNIDSGPLFSCAGPPIPYVPTEEEIGGSVISVIRNPLHSTTETITGQNNNNNNHDQDVMIIEPEQHQQNQSFSRPPTSFLQTPPSSRLYIADDDEETENEMPSTNRLPKTVPTFSRTFHQQQQQPRQDQQLQPGTSAEYPLMTTSPLSSPTASSEPCSSSRTSPGFDFSKSKPIFDAYFQDKPMLRGYYKLLQDVRPQDLPRYLLTVGQAHNLQDPQDFYENLVEFGKTNASKLLADSKDDSIQICTKCNEANPPLPEKVISALNEICNSKSEDATKQALFKVTRITSDDLSNGMEKLFKLTFHNIQDTSPPAFTAEIRNTINSTLKAAEIYEKCSIIWNPEPLKNIKIGVADEFFNMKLLNEDEKQKIVRNSGCEHNWIHRQHHTRRIKKLINNN